MEQQPEFPLARVLLAIVPAALVFLFFVSVLFVPVHSASEELPSPRDVMVVLDDDAPAMAYGAWLDAQRQKAASSHVIENAICAICLDAVERRDSVRDLPCSHVFHTGCLDGWVSRGHYYCPLCHRPVLQLGDDDAHGEV